MNEKIHLKKIICTQVVLLQRMPVISNAALGTHSHTMTQLRQLDNWALTTSTGTKQIIIPAQQMSSWERSRTLDWSNAIVPRLQLAQFVERPITPAANESAESQKQVRQHSTRMQQPILANSISGRSGTQEQSFGARVAPVEQVLVERPLTSWFLGGDGFEQLKLSLILIEKMNEWMKILKQSFAHKLYYSNER